MISLIPPCCTILFIFGAQMSIAYEDKQNKTKPLATLKNNKRKCMALVSLFQIHVSDDLNVPDLLLKTEYNNN